MHFEVSIDVAAPPQVVFDVYADVAHWPDWTDSVTSVERLDGGPLRVGSRTRVRQPRLPVAVWEVTDLSPGHSFTWVARGPGVRTTASHVVTPAGTNGSHVTATLDQEGLLGPLVGRTTKGMTERYIDMELRGLKRHCEGGAGAPSAG